MRIIVGILIALTSCGNYFSAPDATVNACMQDGGVGTFTLTTPQPIPPVNSDLLLHGAVVPQFGVNITQLFVGGIAATHDGADFSAFEVTVPLSTIQQTANAQGSPVLARLVATATTNCGDTLLELGDIDVRLQAATTFVLALGSISDEYLPATISSTASLTITANPEAAGMPINVTTTIGTLVGDDNATLKGDGVTASSQVFYLDSETTTPGVAAILAQTTNAGSAASIPIAGPPSLVPPGGQLIPGTLMTVFLNNILTRPTLASSIQGCSALADPKIEVLEGAYDISGSGLTPLSENDTEGHPVFHIHTDPDAGSGVSATVECIDIYGQSVTGTYTVEP